MKKPLALMVRCVDYMLRCTYRSSTQFLGTFKRNIYCYNYTFKKTLKQYTAMNYASSLNQKFRKSEYSESRNGKIPNFFMNFSFYRILGGLFLQRNKNDLDSSKKAGILVNAQ
jgi:hypothetical protein